MLVHKAQMLQILIAHRFIEGETTLYVLKSLDNCVTHVENCGCDDHAALAPRLQNPITERIPIPPFTLNVGHALTNIPKTFTYSPKSTSLCLAT